MTVKIEVISTFEDTFMGNHQRTIRRWLITSDTGFRAEIPECPCGLRQQIGVKYKPVPHDAPDWNTRTREVEEVYSIPRIECLCAYDAGRCTRATADDRDRRCHGWHQKRIDELTKSFTKKPPRRKTITGPKYSGKELIPVPINWPERRDPRTTAELDLCSCETCTQTAELFNPKKASE